MPIPLRYNLRSLFYRKTATVLTLMAIALTVAILIVLLAVSEGFQRSMAETGREDNLVCLRVGSTSEGDSTITREDAHVLRATPGLAAGPGGQPLAAAELYAAVALEREGGGTTNVPLRGVAPESFFIRDRVRIAQGRPFRPGSREILVGRGLVGRVRGCQPGGTVRISKDAWDVVGIMEAGGTAFDSEIWGDAELLLQAFDRNFYNLVILRAAEGTEVGEAATYQTEGGDRRPVRSGTGLLGHITERLGTVKVMTELDYFTAQAGFLGGTLKGLAILLTLLMSVGALAGCTNTLLAAVAGRTREIGGLLALGYRPRHIFLGFLLESLLLALLGGALGIAATLPVNNLKTGTTNWQTFTEQAFTFRIDGSVIALAILLVVVVGLVGGVLPAWRASRLRPVDALRRG